MADPVSGSWPRPGCQHGLRVVCDELAEKLHETCFISRLGQKTIRSIARRAPDQGHRLHVLPGAQLPAHAAASAKAILAFQPEEVLQRILGEDLPALTDRTKTDLDAVRAELEQVRRDGHAICDREIDPSVMAYACPVKVQGAGVLYSVGVTGRARGWKHAPRTTGSTPCAMQPNALPACFSRCGASCRPAVDSA